MEGLAINQEETKQASAPQRGQPDVLISNPAAECRAKQSAAHKAELETAWLSSPRMNSPGTEGKKPLQKTTARQLAFHLPITVS